MMNDERYAAVTSPEVMLARRHMGAIARAITAAKACQVLLRGSLDPFRHTGELGYLRARLSELRDEASAASDLFNRHIEELARPTAPEREGSTRPMKKRRKNKTE